MFSSSPPCPKGRLVYLKSQDERQEIHLCLVEDKVYYGEQIREALEGTLGQRNGEVETLYEAVRSFFNDIKRSAIGLIRIFHDDRVSLDLSLPRVHDDRLFTGEFPGDYIIHEDPLLVLHVKPKVGWDRYEKMIGEVRSAVTSLINQTGILEPFLSNLLYPFFNTPVSYSLILIRLTEYILSSVQPKSARRSLLISSGEVGKPYLPGTRKFISQGLSLGVFERTCVETHLYPFMLLAKFHYLLANLLQQIERYLVGVGGRHVAESKNPSVFSDLITATITALHGLHVDYLSMYPLSDAFQALRRNSVSDTELIAETRRATRVNPHFEILADLYEMYYSRIGLLHKYIGEARALPILSSSKIYELWVLTRIIEYFKRIGLFQRPKIERHGSFFVEFDLGLLKLDYNKPQEETLINKIAGGHLRPDFVFKRDGKSIVYDAKYKRKLHASDVERLLAYIMECAEPIENKNTKYLVGGFYKLKDVESKHEAYYIKKIDSTVSVRINVCILDPSLDNDMIEKSLKSSLQFLL